MPNSVCAGQFTIPFYPGMLGIGRFYNYGRRRTPRPPRLGIQEWDEERFVSCKLGAESFTSPLQSLNLLLQAPASPLLAPPPALPLTVVETFASAIMAQLQLPSALSNRQTVSSTFPAAPAFKTRKTCLHGDITLHNHISFLSSRL